MANEELIHTNYSNESTVINNLTNKPKSTFFFFCRAARKKIACTYSVYSSGKWVRNMKNNSHNAALCSSGKPFITHNLSTRTDIVPEYLMRKI